MLQGEEVSLEEVLNAREERVLIQNKLIQKYNLPVISFTMNIPGPIKTNKDIRKIFDYGKVKLLEKLEKANIKILEIKEKKEKTGDELWIVANTKAENLKKITVEIEETEDVGRIFDMDVIDVNLKKISRKSFRKCLICDSQAQECGRSRRHSIEELQEKVKNIMKTKKIYK